MVWYELNTVWILVGAASTELETLTTSLSLLLNTHLCSSSRYHKACLKHLAHFSKPSKALLLFKAHLPCLRMKPLLTASALFTPDISSLSRASCLQYTFLNWLYSIRHFDHLKHYLLLKTSSDLPPPGISGPLCILRSQQRFFFFCFFVCWQHSVLCIVTILWLPRERTMPFSSCLSTI